MANETIVSQVDLNKGVEFISYISKTITQKIVEFLSGNGFIVSERWAGMLLLFLIILLFFVAMKISKPLLKWGLIIIGVALGIGLLIPW